MRHRTDQINRFVADVGEHRTRSKNEHDRDDRRRDENRAADVARGGARFAGENGDVFESAERANGKFAEDIEAIEDRHRRQRELKRLITF